MHCHTEHRCAQRIFLPYFFWTERLANYGLVKKELFMRNNDIISFNVASAIFSVLCSLNWYMWCQIYSYYSNDFKSAPGKKDCTGEIMLNTMTRESKYRKNYESCPTKVTWKVKFKCPMFCLSHLSCLSCLSKNLIYFKITKKYNLSPMTVWLRFLLLTTGLL